MASESESRVRPKRFAFISSNFTWGGSEELWSLTAAALAREGHRVTAYKNRLKPHEGNVDELRGMGVRLIELARFPFLPNALFSAIFWISPPLSVAWQALRLHLSLRLRKRPDLVIISQGGNHDAFLLAGICRRLGHPFVLISQKATDLYWPRDNWLKEVRAIYAEAIHAFFVSEHNHRLTEEQIGCRIERASVTRNPFMVPWTKRRDWPGEENGLRLACVGRLYPKEKGQDMLLRVLASAKWRGRPLSVTFFGSGEQQEALQAMAAYHGLSSVRFGGYAENVAAIWDDHHGLVLPTRAEGLPLVLVEAMMSGRVAIVTDVAGNREVLEDERTGFIADAPSEQAIDDALERAWARRAEWRAIGDTAADRIRTLVPADPARTLAAELVAIAERIGRSGGEIGH
ncbi:glycosyltransferase family 4 protein [Sphingosinicella sp. BN140058]|uniref:glycosyltransferase family 4 protein n=1 Tax=Sphingosinicella sp. BN140058 TaxID=1892855 RepID=UPI0013EA3DBF|nr:glycosyltransferase family 4 protein [Sphingosinicella sp. BN140058]